MKLTITFLINLLLITSCQIKEQDKTASAVSVETLGDSVRIETEVRDSLIIKKFMDLKGTSDDGFDDSYEVFLRYEQRKNLKLPQTDYKFDIGSYTFCFDSEEVKSTYERIQKKVNSQSIRSNPKERSEWAFVEMYGYYINLLEGNIQEDELHPADLDFWKIELISNCNFMVLEKEKGKVKSILIEHYETSFSGGRNFSVLTVDNDTVNLIHHNDWMR